MQLTRSFTLHALVASLALVLVASFASASASLQPGTHGLRRREFGTPDHRHRRVHVRPHADLVDRASSSDPCAAIGGKTWAKPADALACMKSFAFNETLRANLVDGVSKALNLYTLEYYALNAPEFHQSYDRVKELDRISKTEYATDFDFNFDLFNSINSGYNDGHTFAELNCYWSVFENLIPFPIVSINDVSYVAPDVAEVLATLDGSFLQHYLDQGIDPRKYAGWQVIAAAGQPIDQYVEFIANTQTGVWLDPEIRRGSVYSTYRLRNGGKWGQRFGDFAARVFPTETSVNITLAPPIIANSTSTPVTNSNSSAAHHITLDVPFYAQLVGQKFTDKASYWANNCAATNTSNGQPYTPQTGTSQSEPGLVDGKRAIAKQVSLREGHGVVKVAPPPTTLTPALPLLAGGDILEFYMLPDNVTGVIMVGSFGPTDYNQFQINLVNGVTTLANKGAKKLVVDVSNNGGGYVCLGNFMVAVLGGMSLNFPGFQSALRDTPLAIDIVEQDVKKDIYYAFYSPDDWISVKTYKQFSNTTIDGYIEPMVNETINGRHDVFSQLFGDECQPYAAQPPSKPLIPLDKIVIVGNGLCASTCALFTTLMHERFGTKIVVYGGKTGLPIQYKGMGGNQVLEYADMRSEALTAGVENNTLAPPALFVNANMRVNWRNAYSYKQKNTPIAYAWDPADLHLSYSFENYNNPVQLWTDSSKLI